MAPPSPQDSHGQECKRWAGRTTPLEWMVARTSQAPSGGHVRAVTLAKRLGTGRLGPRMPNKYSVTLTPVTEDDYELLSQWTSSDTWVYASGIQGHTSAADLKAFLARVDDKFLIVCTPDGQPLGMVSWKPTDTPGNYVVGTMIGDAGMWGAGFGLEATILLVGMLFDSKNAHRVEFTCGTFNRRAVENFCAGMITVEGVLRDRYFVDGAYHDALIGSVLRDEYYALRRPSEIVPAADKDAARRLVADFLEKNPIVPRDVPAAAPTATEGQRA
ncbi:GNAT family N-acetyltransferase [Actinomadura madurae]|uniref:GNAT family N-acetyltransferase n=1 Tax=Actinomadura madurae TaxID=1993 RepID=UPI0009F9A88A